MKKLLIIATINLLFDFSLTAQVSEIKILPGDGNEHDWFGYSVSISGDYVIVGAPANDDNGSNSGSAYIYKRNSPSWIEVQKLLASDGVQEDRFGGSVSISDDYVIIGAAGNDDNGMNSGSAYIFKWDGSNWADEIKLVASDGAQEDFFGRRVSISGDFAVVGSHGDDDKGFWSGSAYIFKRDGSNWVEEQKLVASDGDENDTFGTSVSISGDYIIIGAPGDGDNGTLSGSAYIFRRQDSTWIEDQKLLASDGDQEDFFGRAVSISSNRSIVGVAYNDDNGLESGSAYIFRRDGINWIEEQKLLASDSEQGDLFGYAVSIFKDYTIIGALQDNASAFWSGSAYLFKRSGTSWAEEHKLIASDGVESDAFGYSVSIYEDHCIIGAYVDDDNGENSGSAYIFTDFVVGIEDEQTEMLPSFNLKQNYPNPFNPSTTIKFSLPSSGFVTLKIYNALGEEVAVLLDKEFTTGTYKVEWNDTGLPSGVYFYQLQTKDFIETKKMLLLK
jgi:hypothetical protein